MTASPFTITPTPPTSLKLEVGQDGTFSFTVTSLAAPDSAQDLILEAQRLGVDGKGATADWLVIGPTRSLTLTGGQTATVTIAARPRSTSPLGESRIQLAVADSERPHDVYAYSAPVSCEVTARPAPPPVKKLPKWLIPAIVGAVLVLGLNIFLIVKVVGGGDGKGSGTTGGGVGAQCTTAAQCLTGLVCTNGACAQPAPGTFTVMLVEAGANKIAVIKLVREVTGLGLKEAKDLVDGAPTVVRTTNDKGEAVDLVKRLEEIGAKAEIK